MATWKFKEWNSSRKKDYNNKSGSRICIDTQVINWFYFFWLFPFCTVSCEIMTNLKSFHLWGRESSFHLHLNRFAWLLHEKGFPKRKVNEVENARITKFKFVYWNREKNIWAANDRMFPNTPEASQMVFSVLWKPVWLIWSCPNNYLFVLMS